MFRNTLRALAAAVVATSVLITPAGAESPLLGAETDLGVLARTEGTLSTLLGRAYANSWLDSASGRLVVGITNPARAGEVRDHGAVPVVLRHSAIELDGITSKLDSRAGAGRVPSSVTGWYVDVVANQVVVSMIRPDAESVAWAHSAGGPVRVERVAQRPRPLWDLRGGDGITFNTNASCTAGFNARGSDGQAFVLTAGHCSIQGGIVTGPGGQIGPVVASSFPGNDFGLVAVTNPTVWPLEEINDYAVCCHPRPFPRGVIEALIGAPVCRSGISTGWRCGTVEAKNQTIFSASGAISGLTRTSACAEPGDSGGPVVSVPEADGGFQAQGIVSVGTGTCATGGKSFFQPVVEALGTFNLVLYEDARRG